MAARIAGETDAIVPQNTTDGTIPTATSEESLIWIHPLEEGSLPEVYNSIEVPCGENIHWTKKMLYFIGPGSLIAVGYMDPGNWSTDLAGGSAFGYRLLFIILLSSFIAMFLQFLAIKVGYGTGRDLAQACRDSYPQYLVYLLWFVMEVAIAACDLAEVIGSAIALNLLFELPIIAGVCITAADVFLILFMQNKRFQWIERLVASLVFVVTSSFLYVLILSNPKGSDVMIGYLPSSEIFTEQQCLYVAIGIVGATVMPHNLFLHSSIVLTRSYSKDDVGISEAIKFSTYDSCISLSIAMFVNSSILILSAAVFFKNQYFEVATLQDAYLLLDPLLGGKAASTIFAIALLASGQSSTITGTLAGQIVMEGFLTWKIHPAWRRVITRGLAIVPAIITVLVAGDHAVNDLLILSQVTLSYALPFAVFPLVHITSDPRRMGAFANSKLVTFIAYLIAFFILTLNIALLAISD